MAIVKLPSLCENVEKGIIVSILVKIGDTITQDQALIEVETDKVTAEVPAEFDGKVSAILVKNGEEISEGTAFMEIETEASASIPQEPEESPEVAEVPELDSNSSETTTAIIEAPKISRVEITQIATRKNGFRASPLAKKMAKEIGLEIATIPVTRNSGRISVEDVKAYARQLNQNRANGSLNTPQITLPDFNKWGTTSRQSMSGILQATSKNMSTAWSQIPHAWLQEKADITELEAKRQTYKHQVKAQGGSLTITAILVKVIAKALEKFPIFNASFDPQQKEIIFKEYIHIGVAVDTDRGLLVPKIEHANQKSITEIALDLGELSQKTKAKKLSAADLEGATFTISNLGGIGTTSIFPIVNFPQVAILGIAASKKEAVWKDEDFQAQLLMPMTIGFDHRIINGADAARFLQEIKALLEDCFLWSL